ncbi:MAG: hypothetical protein HOK60_00120 [Planctomycetes bacterium]|jgi:hypothetical protein|nr:hypothetical protein [Planctomycetota bacterium]MBT6967930.1 hypothetical protein [Planctomycetota bacterium]
MRSSTLPALLMGLVFFWIGLSAPGFAQDPAEKPESTSEKSQPIVQPDESESSDEVTPEDPLDIDPLDIDPLDILDSADPLGKVGTLVDEISRNMKEIEDLLEEEDTSDKNQSVQQQTLSVIDELITEVQRLTGS